MRILETYFVRDIIMNSHFNLIQQLNNLITVIYIIYKKNERIINFLTILKLFKISGFQTKIVFKLRFKYLKNEKITFIKSILKLECLLYQKVYFLFHLILYS